MSTKMAEDEEWEVAFGGLGTFLSVLGAATAAGLTMGLMSLDSLDLLVIVESDPNDCSNEQERKELEEEKLNAQVLLPLLDDHHRLLVTLLLLNSLCAEALPIFLDQLVPTSVAVLLGVFFLLVFGEILPSAVFTGPAGMRTAARLAPLVRCFLFCLAPVAIPFGRFLDWWVGDEEDNVYNRSELLALLRIHSGKSAGKLLTVKQSRMMQGAMDLMHMTAAEVMTPIDKMFMLSTETELNLSMMAGIVGKGYSRIPVYEKANRNKIRGILLTKSLAVVSPADNIPVGNLFARPCGCVGPQTHLYEALAMMRATRSHMCLVTDDPVKLSKFMQRQAGAFVPYGTEDIISQQQGRLKTHASASSKEATWTVLGCLSLHDIVSVVVAGDVADEYSSRRPPKPIHLTIAYEDSDFSDNDEEESIPRRPRSGDTSMTTGKGEMSEHIEFKSKFAKDKVMKWVERARLSTKLHREQLELERQKGQTSVLGGRTEASPLLTSKASIGALTGSIPDHRAKSSAVARKLLSSWLLKRTAPVTLTKSEVDSTLSQVTGMTRRPSEKSLAIVIGSSGSSIVSKAGSEGRGDPRQKKVIQPSESDEETV